MDSGLLGPFLAPASLVELAKMEEIKPGRNFFLNAKTVSK
jgi:hypothetical protein